VVEECSADAGSIATGAPLGTVSGMDESAIEELRQALAPWFEAERSLEARAQEWAESDGGVRFERLTLACPQQLSGEVDGVPFYFRERHGEWCLEILPAAWDGYSRLPLGREIAYGYDDDYRDVVELIQLIAARMRAQRA
jgi:hypothetical protein